MGRAFQDLRNNAVSFWPSEIVQKAADQCVIPRLIETQDKFISLLHVADTSPTCWKAILPKTKGLPGNLFLKHLQVLTDLGGEPLKRLKTELPAVFPQGRMAYVWRDQEYSYEFQTLHRRIKWDNPGLSVDAKGMAQATELTPAMEDVAMLLLFGGLSDAPDLPEVLQEKCVLGRMLGSKAELDIFVRQRYIWVSRITGGATANALGHHAQDFVRERLQSLLPGWDFSNTTIPGASQTGGRTDISFDMVAASPKGRYCAIEVSFQFTTNSTIERKEGQAKSRHALLARNGHKIAYVIDGAGNFERSSAIATICKYSDCIVTFKETEVERLAHFLEALDSEGAE